MTVILGTRALRLLLTIIICSAWIAISAQTQAPPTNEALGNNTVSTASKAEPNDLPAPASAETVTDTASTGSDASRVHPDLTAQAPPKSQPDDSYIVGIADELQISVWKEPDLSGPVVVRPDGMITVPVVNDVSVVGLTTKQVQDILTDKLKDVVSEPQVTVIVRTIKSRKVYLMGQVGRPGAVALSGHETALQIIAESGGIGMYAKGDKIYVLRKVDGHEQKIPFHYKRAVNGDLKADFQLENGDVIVVP